MKDFKYWKKLHENENLEEFSQNKIGLLWLKTKSILRKELIAEFIKINKIEFKETTLAKQFIELFDLLVADTDNSNQILDEFIRVESDKQAKKVDTTQLVSELYKLKIFNWGGDYQNSLDKYLISKYVKVHQSFDTLISKFEAEINLVVQSYVLNSWYNHWSSILIEHILNHIKLFCQLSGRLKVWIFL